MTAARFAEVQARALSAKRQAKNVRKEWKHRESGSDRANKFEAAVRELDDVVAALEEWRGDDSPYRRDAERDIGDCLGVKGGTYRDWGKYREAAFSYDAGLPYEQRAQELGAQLNSYCLVQRLVCRILAEPAAFQQSQPILDMNDLDVELEHSARVVREQIPKRNDKSWAQADLALLLQLLGGKAGRGFEAATAAWDELDDMKREPFVYETTLETVKPLKERLDPFLDPTARAAWADLVSRLAH